MNNESIRGKGQGKRKGKGRGKSKPNGNNKISSEEFRRKRTCRNLAHYKIIVIHPDYI